MATAASYILDGSLNADKLIFYRLEDYPEGHRGWGITRTPPNYDIKPSHTSLQSTIPLGAFGGRPPAPPAPICGTWRRSAVAWILETSDLLSSFSTCSICR